MREELIMSRDSWLIWAMKFKQASKEEEKRRDD
jgi:hypothetical protein